MALLAESLVEEWLNREGFFTIRGVKHGIGEMDLLAVHPHRNGVITGWHVEVQVSFRPVAYIAKWDKSQPGAARVPNSAKKRSVGEIEGCARKWVSKKFQARDKIALRESLWPGVSWEFHFVYAVVKDPREVEFIGRNGVVLHAFDEILETLSRRADHKFSSSAGGDLAEVVSYFRSSKRP